MGLWDTVKNTVKEVGKNISESKESKNLENEIETKILRRFSFSQLKKLCQRYGRGPSNQRISPLGHVVRVRLISDDYENYAKNNVSLRTLIEFARTNKIRTDDIIMEFHEREKAIKAKYHPKEILNSHSSKSKIFQNVIDAVNQFEPSRVYHNEQGYHTELQGWMKAHFPNAKVEHQTGSSRPDIVIDDRIAIEVKGPTCRQDLQTIADKCNRYLQYYDRLAVVLFEVNVNERFYEEWIKGITERYTEVEIIRK